MALVLISRSLIDVELIFLSGVRGGSNSFLLSGFPAPFVEKTVLSPPNSLGALVWRTFSLGSLLYSFGLSVCLDARTTLRFVVVLKAASVRPPTLFFFKIVVAVQRSRMNLRMDFSISANTCCWDLDRVALSLGHSGGCGPLRTVSLPVREHGVYLLVAASSFISSSSLCR